MSDEKCCTYCAEAETKSVRFRNSIRAMAGRVRLWLFLNLWCRHGYRPTMRLLHRFNLHYAPPRGLMHGEQPGSSKDHWCQWCGLRGTTVNDEWEGYKTILK